MPAIVGHANGFRAVEMGSERSMRAGAVCGSLSERNGEVTLGPTP